MALLLLGASPLCPAEVYRCVDKHGTTVFSDIPCDYDDSAHNGNPQATQVPAAPEQATPSEATPPAEPANLPAPVTRFAPARTLGATPSTMSVGKALLHFLAPIVFGLVIVGAIWLLALVSRTKTESVTESSSSETETPRVFSLMLSGRVGRLRYLAFSWAMALPVMLLVGLIVLMSGGLTAMRRGGVGALSTVLIVVAMLVYLWLSIRVMVLRLHDLNRSGTWVLGLFIVSLVVGVIAGASSVNALVVRTLMWIVAWALLLWPGTRGENNYGPPPGINSFGVVICAFLVPLLMVLAVLRMGRLTPH